MVNEAPLCKVDAKGDQEQASKEYDWKNQEDDDANVRIVDVPSHLKGQYKQEGKDGGRDYRAASKTHPMKCEQIPNRLIRCVHSGQIKPDCKGSNVANLSNTKRRCTAYL
jgi:hypothetical protein